MQRKIIFMLAVLVSTAGFAQTRKLSLQEAIELAVKNSGQLKGAEAKIDEATAALKEAVERKLPDVTASASYLRLSHANIDLKNKSSNSSGGTQQSSPEISQVVYGMLNASLPIYAGGRIKYGIEAAQYLQQAAKFDAQSQRPEVQLNAVNAYINFYKASSMVSLVKENLETMRQRLKDLSNLEQNGLLARNDLMKAQLQESNIELTLLDAENNWKLANVSTNLLLGLPETTMLQVDSNTVTAPFNTQLQTLESYEQSALQNRNELEAITYRTKAAGVAVKSASAEKLPSIALTGGYIAADIPGFVTVTNAVNIGVRVQYNLSSLWKNKSKIEQAKSRQKQLEISQGIMSDNIRLQVNKSYENYILSQKKIEVYIKAIDQATENYRIVKNKFENSLATTTDVLDADVALLQARINYSNAKADAVLAYNQLLQSSGMLNNTK